MSAHTLQEARELLQQKRYDEARVVLKSLLDLPKARKWLAQLDRIAPEKPEVDDSFDEFLRTEPDYEDADGFLESFPDSPIGSDKPGKLTTLPQRATTAPQPSGKSRRYSAVSTLAMIYYLIAGLLFIGFTFIGVFAILDANNASETGGYFLAGYGIFNIIIGFIASITFVAIGQLLEIMVELARNSRAQKDSLKQIERLLNR